MKMLNLSIIAILVLSASCLFLNNVYAYAQQDNSTVRFAPINGFKLEVALDQGDSASLPVRVSLPPGDRMINLMLLVSPWPDGIYGLVSPQVLQNAYEENTTLKIYVQPYVRPGNYTMDIAAEGWVNDTSGKNFMVNSEPPTPLVVDVEPHAGKISLAIGNMTDMKKMAYCYNNGCSSFISTEQFRLLLKSESNATLSVGAPDVPGEKWVHFDPATVNVGPDGAEGTMTIGGMVQSLTGNNPISTKILTVRAESEDGSAAQAYFPYEDNSEISVLHGAEPINFTQKFTTNIDSNNYGVYGVVYDPGNNGSIQVHLSVAGLEQEGRVVSLPPSIDAKINRTSFVLNSSEIYYVPVIVRTSNASVGDHYVAINETIGGRQFFSTLPIYVMPNICTGGPGMCNPSHTLEDNENRTKVESSNDATSRGMNNPPAVLSPLEQFKSGIPASKVSCKQGFQLILKKEDHSPACINPGDATKLVSQRGWGLPIN